MSPVKATILHIVLPDWLIESLARLAGWLRGLWFDKSTLFVEARVRAYLLNLKYEWKAHSVGRYVIFDRPQKISLQKGVALHHGVKILTGATGFCEIGANSHISHDSVLAAGGDLRVGKDCALSSGLAIYTATNVRINGIALHNTPIKTARVEIGDGVLIGANATILPGISVGDGAVIGAGSIVTRDVALSIVVAGNPAKKIKTIR